MDNHNTTVTIPYCEYESMLKSIRERSVTVTVTVPIGWTGIKYELGFSEIEKAALYQAAERFKEAEEHVNSVIELNEWIDTIRKSGIIAKIKFILGWF